MNEQGGPGPADGDRPDLPATLHVPDDPSALEADVLALRRERAAARRRERLRRLTGAGRLHRWGISLPAAIAVLALVAGLGALLVLLGPDQRTDTSQPRVQPSATAQPGRPGGRLPAVQLHEPDGTTLAAGILTGPATLLLVPTGCDCASTVQDAAALTVHAGHRLYVVEPTTGAASGIDAGGDAAHISAYTDPAGTLLGTYGATGTAPTLLLLDDTGAVRTVTTGLTRAAVPAALADLPD